MIKKIEKAVNILDRINTFAFVGDPGCDGLGAEIMSVFNLALNNSDTDFLLVAGDIVPIGSPVFYGKTAELMDSICRRPVYMLCGNHDTHSYEDYFGRKNYFICDDRLLIVVLDNSKRSFSEETLNVLREALNNYSRENIVIAFHIPPPNTVAGNSVTEKEWAKITEVIEPYKKNIRYFLSGHVHSYFEDDLDGIKLICTGGGGARIEPVDGISSPYHHVVEFYYGDSGLSYRIKTLCFVENEFAHKQQINESLFDSFKEECIAHVKYRLYAEDAQRRNMPNTAKLFLAIADSEFYHARNYYFAMNRFKEPRERIADSIFSERNEVDNTYASYLEQAKKEHAGIAAYAFNDAREAERIHLGLLEKAYNELAGKKDIFCDRFYTCTSCGLTFHGGEHPKMCHVCGAPSDKIKEVVI